MKFVQQVDDKTCGHACMSMVTGWNIASLISHYGDKPLDDVAEAIILTEAGILPVPVLQMGGVMNFNPGYYLMSVPSLNVIGLGHRLILRVTAVIDVFDPQRGRPDRQSYPIDAMRGGTPPCSWFAEVVFLHPMEGHSATPDRIQRYDLGGYE